MWWEEFEKQLTSAFATYDKKENRQVYSDETKLRIRIKKVNADFLGNANVVIDIKLTRPVISVMYNQALQNFRNKVNTKFPLDMGRKNRFRRSINEINGCGGRGYRDGR